MRFFSLRLVAFPQVSTVRTSSRKWNFTYSGLCLPIPTILGDSWAPTTRAAESTHLPVGRSAAQFRSAPPLSRGFKQANSILPANILIDEDGAPQRGCWC
ncbi:hypothetical protein C8R46DRAFT_396844 [Mycena filopes]|nr:hypothetical protein C8R46DRAFT_396844 [Mycena filopes]